MNTVFSSYALYKILRTYDLDNDERRFVFEFINDSMIIDGVKKADVTRSTKEFFQFNTTSNHLRNLRDVLGKISDQPVTIRFPQGSSWIEIKHLEC